MCMDLRTRARGKNEDDGIDAALRDEVGLAHQLLLRGREPQPLHRCPKVNTGAKVTSLDTQVAGSVQQRGTTKKV